MAHVRNLVGDSSFLNFKTISEGLKATSEGLKTTSFFLGKF
jgi:hypothetical protein